MELKVSSPKLVLSSSDCNSGPEEKEISEDDDDDRNHKHRRRETHSESVETDPFESVLTRPYRKRNKPIGNGHLYKDSESASFEKEQSVQFEKKRGMNSFSRPQHDSNLRIRSNQSLSGEPGLGRARGREPGIWGQRDSRFNPNDIASQMAQQVPVPPGLFAGRGLPNVSNTLSSPWSSFGMIPRMPITGLDPLHPLGLQGALRTPMNPTIGMGIPRQRCKDFEERGFCLRGDMCPMEHGMNRIVIEDVQSLSQFNLPVSLSNAPLLGTASGQGALPAVLPSCSLVNSKAHMKGGKPVTTDDGLGLNEAHTGGSVAGGADVYDPDQPLWTSVGETVQLMDMDPSDHGKPELSDGYDIEHPTRSNLAATVSQGVWGRIGSSKGKLEIKEKVGPTVDSSSHIENETKKDLDSLSSQGVYSHGKHINVENLDPAITGTSFKSQTDSGCDAWKSCQKAHSTLFVNGIPQKDNRREAIFSHFKKFGEVIDIYIPQKNERAFVQFSKREEAEAALKAPDAVMGNRFIKLRWANRDNIPHNGATRVMPASAPPHLSAAHKGKDSIQSVPRTIPNMPKPMVANIPKAPAPPQKKMESIELLREELRKKQEMLDQKRNEFRRQLDEFEKQASVLKDEGPCNQVVKRHKVEMASGLKDEGPSDQVAKRPKVEKVADFAKAETSSSTEPDIAVSSQHTEVVPDSNRSANNALLSCSKSSSPVATSEPSSLKQSIRPLAPVGAPFIFNRYKLDNRPTAFKINPPIPSGLANAAVLKDHFSAFGELSSVELEATEVQDKLDTSKISAQVSFASRRSAERAFLNGKSWQGHTLQFTWLPFVNSNKGGVKENASACKDLGIKENTSSSCQLSSDTNTPTPMEDTPSCSLKTAVVGTSKTENIEKGKSDPRTPITDEDSQSGSAKISPEKQSFK
ncbi:zinc finger CCCH domain-containing protein 41 [Ipomoea triloba]|uniref:zinc finger CCCH domain-containing protein 41 n=1 Tax=Ipomoea triloba TaxID=35885 RepID=UPI00125CFF6A|nr:zinc finger CCCH domain-containing protein 41 [Ipomoea triloba]XP_031094353.1 zinc finger CCCH domain-containing protein 41 [Ipomoea triloba]XP_031094354.1 zinc finger CCCH domain-containing protein 41 [Ipomoea triloba]XP_031094355.1 zinc finger CCCH domain-containing protein 41 [Ipomoea triloba]